MDEETASSLPSTLVTSIATKMEDASELEESLGESDSDSGSDCDFSAGNRPNKKKVFKYDNIVQSKFTAIVHSAWRINKLMLCLFHTD